MAFDITYCPQRSPIDLALLKRAMHSHTSHEGLPRLRAKYGESLYALYFLQAAQWQQNQRRRGFDPHRLVVVSDGFCDQDAAARGARLRELR